MLPMDSLPFPFSKPTFCLPAVCGKAQDSHAGCILHAIKLAAKATLHALGVGPHPDTCDMSNVSGLLDMIESDKVEFEDDDSVFVCSLDVEMDEADSVDARVHDTAMAQGLVPGKADNSARDKECTRHKLTATKTSRETYPHGRTQHNLLPLKGNGTRWNSEHNVLARAYSIQHALQRFRVKYCTTFGVYALSEPEWKQPLQGHNDAPASFGVTPWRCLPILYRLRKSLVKIVQDPTKVTVNNAVAMGLTKFDAYYDPMKTKKCYIMATGLSFTTLSIKFFNKLGTDVNIL
ncbi:hypothetical protein BT69DRAFT_1300772 [Atractiella rhizophila]|nr:hypothetical protein BT69DRAFT_1300772 [Atractiella rhizophila]